MKLFIKLLTCLSLLAACEPVPMTQDDASLTAHQVQYAQMCVNAGYVSYLPAVMNLISTKKQALAYRATPEQLQVARDTDPSSKSGFYITAESCRAVDAAAVQLAQSQEQARREEELSQQHFNATMDRIAADNRSRTYNYGPTSCQYYAWGATTFCN